MSALTGELTLKAAMNLSQEGLTLSKMDPCRYFITENCKNLELSTIKIFTAGKSFSACNNHFFCEVQT